jgi:hypothetical protein
MMSDMDPRELQLLDRCISRILSGEVSIEACLLEIPEHRDQFEPLLQTALSTHRQAAPLPPSETFAKNSKIRVLNRIAAAQPSKPVSQKTTRPRVFRPAYGLLGLILAIGLSFTVVLNTSAASLPGDPLYGVKRGIEEARLALTISSANDVKLLLQFSDERLQEMAVVLEIDRQTDALAALDHYREIVDRLLELTSEGKEGFDDVFLNEILLGLEHHEEILQEALEKAAPSAKKGIENALKSSSHGKAVLEQIRQGGSPSDLAPGQQKKTEQPNSGGGRPEDKPDKEKKKDKTPGPPDNPGN